MGVSQGGMMAQAMAIRHPEVVNKLVLCVTAPGPNPTMEQVVGRWIDLAQAGDWKTFNTYTFQTMYSKAYLKKYGAIIPLVAGLSKCADVPRFVTLAKSCITFDCMEELPKIKAPTFVIGAKDDQVLTGEASQQIADALSCKLYLYEEYSHGVYDEAPDFNDRIFEFLKNGG
jgi:pimeloyl-ACP methyl ester carboxylesterase